MAAHSNRSPSPLCSRPTNPNLRNSDKNSANRRSFSGNNLFSRPSVLTNSRRFDPVTPANSPSDFASRRSVGEEKENDEKEDMLKASKLQSPAKGCKNFMSPTISAASKFTPSPRKKVLVERNDPVRTSISLSDGKAMFFSSMSSNVSEHSDSKSEMGHHQKQRIEGFSDSKVADLEKQKAVHEGHPVSKPSKRVSFSDVPSDSMPESESISESVLTDSNSLKMNSVITDSNSLKHESSLKNKVVSPSIAPLDADPSLHPYNPKTNYLSPRPQFLHYKPNPRIEILLTKEKELDPEEFKRLQDNLMEEIMAENLSDSSEGTEESQAEDSQNEELEVADSGDMVIGVDEMEADYHVSEPSVSLPISTSSNNGISEEDFVYKNGKKPRSLFRVMRFSALLMFFIACVSICSITHPPHEFVRNDLSLSGFSNLYSQSKAAASVNFDWFSTHVNQLRTSSVSYISKLANELGKGGKQAPLQFMNLSDLQVKYTWSEGHFLHNEAVKGLMENLEEDELEEDLDAAMDSFEEEGCEDINYDEKFEKGYDSRDDVLVTETDTFGEDAYAQSDSHETFEKGFNTEENVVITEETSPGSVSFTEQESEYGHDTQSRSEVIPSINTKHWDDQNSIDQSTGVPVDQETEPEAPFGDALDPASSACTDATFSDNKIPSDLKSEVNTLAEVVQSSSEDDYSFAHRAMGVSSLFAALLAVAAFIYQHKRMQPGSAPLLSKERGNAFIDTKHFIHLEKELTQNLQTEVDVIGSESCPSEMSSSFQMSASYSMKGAANEVASSERKMRKFNNRESLASSSSEFSMGSPSYGSFTTYEKIPIKQGNGEEEIITPVRRSSRIRNHHHITSS